MDYVTYRFTQNNKIPAEIFLNGHTTPVWIQSKWESGEYAKYIIQNGCGHCCTAMALNLHGIKIDPHEEFILCRQLWGEPHKEEPIKEDNFQSANGICLILKEFGLKAEKFGSYKKTKEEVIKHLRNSLESGKQIIFWSHPSDKLPNNPFSTGEHYVIAVGLSENGKILIANSSQKGTAKNGIQYTDYETIYLSLFEESEPLDFTWGRHDLAHSGGYVVVG